MSLQVLRIPSALVLPKLAAPTLGPPNDELFRRIALSVPPKLVRGLNLVLATRARIMQIIQ